MLPLLSILVCTVTERVGLELPSAIKALVQQALPYGDQVQILYLGDNKSMTVGAKRNQLVAISDGRYISFVDDDDTVSEDYVSELIEGTKTNADVIVFDVLRYEDGVEDKVAKYDFGYQKDQNLETHYERLPNHLMCFRRDVAAKTPYMNISFGEDERFAMFVKQHIRTQHRIDKVLYTYWFNKEKTETQK